MKEARFLLSARHCAPLLAAKRQGLGVAETSLDLSLSRATLPIEADGVILPDGALLAWKQIELIAKKSDNCFLIVAGAAAPIVRHSERFHRTYTLRATAAAPTMLISGIPMHRTKGITPDIDTDRKLAAIGRLSGKVLDTTTGLGYTAIAASDRAAGVVTVELDPDVLEIARTNPWSAKLFCNKNIERRIGNAVEVIQEFAAWEFDTVIHDPPTFGLGGDLYARDFYLQVFRVLRRGGRFFHNIGDLQSRSGKTIAKGVAERLRDAGFQKVERHPDAFALVAVR